MTHRAPHPDQRGFTLLELVVAIAVFAVIAAMAYAGLRSILDSRRQVDAALDRLAELQRAVELLSDDLRQIVPRTVRDNQGADEAALRVLHWRASQLLFTRAGHANPLGLPRSSLQRIAYDLEGQTLVRRAYQTLDRAPGEQPLATPVLEAVTGFEIQLLDRNNVWRYDWPPADAPTPQVLPRAVRFSLMLADQGRLTRVLVLQP
jgi:general secretion pathway protein J